MAGRYANSTTGAATTAPSGQEAHKQCKRQGLQQKAHAHPQHPPHPHPQHYPPHPTTPGYAVPGWIAISKASLTLSLFESSAVQAFDVCRGPTSQETRSKLTQHPTLIRNSSHQEVTTHEMHSPLQSLMLASWKARRRTRIMHHHQVIHPHLPARSFLDAVHGSSFFWPVVRLSATGLCSTCTAALYASRLPASGISSWSLCTSARPTCNPCTLTAFCRTAFLRARQRSLPSTAWICATTWLRAAGLQRARTAEDAN